MTTTRHAMRRGGADGHPAEDHERPGLSRRMKRMIRLAGLRSGLALLILTALPANAAHPPAHDPADDPALAPLLAMPFASDLVGAQAARRIAWVEKRDGTRTLLVSDDGAPPRRLTSSTRPDGTSLWGLALSPDGRMLAFVEGGDAEYPGDTPPNADNMALPGRQIVRVLLPDGRNLAMGDGHSPVFSPDGHRLAFVEAGTLRIGAPGQPAQTVFTAQGDLSAPVWSPDGTQIAVEIDRGTHGVIALAAAKPDSPPRYIPPALAFDRLPVFSPDGRSLAFARMREPLLTAERGKGRFWSLHVYDVASGVEHLLWTAPEGNGSRFWAPEGVGLAWTRDGRVLFPWEGSGWLRLCALPASGGPAAPTCLTPDNAEIASYRLSRDGARLFYTANPGDHDRWRAWSQPLSGGAPTALTGPDEQATTLTMAGDDIAVMATGVTRAAHPLVLTDGGRREPALPALPAGVSFVTPQDVRFRSADGLDIHGQIFLPPGGPARHPALIFVHGGPERQMLPAFNAMGYYSNAYLLNQRLAARGYVVLSVNYRSGTGYGLAFRDAPGIGREGASEYRDVRAGALYLGGRADVDARRIGIWGGSWGGYLAALALARDSDLFAVGVDFHGVHDLTQPDLPGLSPEENRMAHDREWRSSPVADLGHWRSPVLLVHGDDDHNVSFDQSTLLARMLTARDIPFEEHVFPGERHAFLRTADWLAAYRWTLHFLDSALRP
ncbi:prolyl oligopeptidase family serine peptidase [Acidomonas methanolica]|uniref:prolyl oligopeptidase family serine peptidase n=1 Tax=Acidomonas methanolica TaxID=437 RepID=UPI002119E055|nr:prolyl oligopeptidase family serine peptidase [Acidomonas methanolica]